jgi:hypothetical protein
MQEVFSKLIALKIELSDSALLTLALVNQGFNFGLTESSLPLTVLKLLALCLD